MTPKIIKIGDSKGAIFPASDLKKLGADVGDELEIVVRKKTSETASDAEVLKTARSILERYKEDFANLAQR
jgi:antitoxin component of MazEF toxin-antitoxin module